MLRPSDFPEPYQSFLNRAERYLKRNKLPFKCTFAWSLFYGYYFVLYDDSMRKFTQGHVAEALLREANGRSLGLLLHEYIEPLAQALTTTPE